MGSPEPDGWMLERCWGHWAEVVSSVLSTARCVMHHCCKSPLYAVFSVQIFRGTYYSFSNQVEPLIFALALWPLSFPEGGNLGGPSLTHHQPPTALSFVRLDNASIKRPSWLPVMLTAKWNPQSPSFLQGISCLRDHHLPTWLRQCTLMPLKTKTTIYITTRLTATSTTPLSKISIPYFP